VRLQLHPAHQGLPCKSDRMDATGLHLPMARTLTDDDVTAIADRILLVLSKRLSEPALPPAPPAPPSPPAKIVPPKLAFTLAELAKELGVSKASVYRLEQRGLIKSLAYLRTKIYSRQEVERFLKDGMRHLENSLSRGSGGPRHSTCPR